jgi:hypothetical protein
MDNQIQRTGQQVLSKLQQDSLAKYNTAVKVAIKIDQGINGTSLFKFHKEVGMGLAVGFVADMIMKQSQFFNLIDNVTDKQCIEIATLMVQDYPNITVEDIQIMFRYAKTGKPGYEKPMSRLDGRIIFNWLNEYLDEKYTRIEELHKHESQQYKEEPISEEGLKVLQSISDAFDKKLEKARERKNTEDQEKIKITAGKHEQYLRENIQHFSNADIESTIKQFESRNRWNSYKDILEFLNNELLIRK